MPSMAIVAKSGADVRSMCYNVSYVRTIGGYGGIQAHCIGVLAVGGTVSGINHAFLPDMPGAGSQEARTDTSRKFFLFSCEGIGGATFFTTGANIETKFFLLRVAPKTHLQFTDSRLPLPWYKCVLADGQKIRPAPDTPERIQKRGAPWLVFLAGLRTIRRKAKASATSH